MLPISWLYYYCLLISAKDCGKLSNPINGTVSYYGTTYGFEANFSCFDGYLFNHSGLQSYRSICGAGGKWIGVDFILCSKYQLHGKK